MNTLERFNSAAREKVVDQLKRLNRLDDRHTEEGLEIGVDSTREAFCAMYDALKGEGSWDEMTISVAKAFNLAEKFLNASDSNAQSTEEK